MEENFVDFIFTYQRNNGDLSKRVTEQEDKTCNEVLDKLASMVSKEIYDSICELVDITDQGYSREMERYYKQGFEDAVKVTNHLKSLN